MVFGALVFKLSVWCGAEGYVSGLWAVASKQQTANRTHNIYINKVNRIINLHLVSFQN